MIFFPIESKASASKRILSSSIFCFFLLTAFFISDSASVSAQNYDNDDIPLYQRPSHKVYKSLAAALAQPDSVFILELKGKKLKEIPEGVFRLHQLVVLDLSRNKIRTIPPEIANLSNLKELDLTNNKLKALPPSIGDLSKLKKLSLNKNVISEIPDEIGKLKLLQILELWDNEIGTLPEEIKNLQNLKVLELRGILFSHEHQKYFQDLLPNTKIHMSPACDCKTF